MNRGSRYSRPLTAGDIDTITTTLASFQQAMTRWLESVYPDIAGDEADALALAGERLSVVMTEIVQYSLAPSVRGLIVIK